MLNILQIRLLEILKLFHSYCVRNNIRYYISYGTMLGAVWHGGFIPWDDDIDVVVPWVDYERLSHLLGNRVKDNFF